MTDHPARGAPCGRSAAPAGTGRTSRRASHPYPLARELARERTSVHISSCAAADTCCCSATHCSHKASRPQRPIDLCPGACHPPQRHHNGSAGVTHDAAGSSTESAPGAEARQKGGDSGAKKPAAWRGNAPARVASLRGARQPRARRKDSDGLGREARPPRRHGLRGPGGRGEQFSQTRAARPQGLGGARRPETSPGR
jgi:hypothetical protein